VLKRSPHPIAEPRGESTPLTPSFQKDFFLITLQKSLNASIPEFFVRKILREARNINPLWIALELTYEKFGDDSAFHEGK
jgi:hypothetical protein